jgi:DNA-binding IclR family transcriptional regulator
VRRLLVALMRAGFVEQDGETRRYRLGAESYVLGTLAASRFSLHSAALDSLARLSIASEDTVFVSVRRDTYAVCLHREEGSFPIRTHVLKAGDRHPLGVGAGSLAILAALPDDEIDQVLASNAEIIAAAYPRFSTAVLKGLVQQTRDQGFAINPGLLMSGSWGIGVPVFDAKSEVAGALSIAAIEQRLGESRQYELSRLLQAEAALLQEKLRSFETSAAGTSAPLRKARPEKPVHTAFGRTVQ